MRSLTEDQMVETCRRGQEAFEQYVRPLLTPADDGKFVAINVDTGEFEIGTDDYVVSKALRTRNPEGRLWLLRVGHKAAFRLGGRSFRVK